MELDADVIIVGARCAGSSLARLLAEAGRRVVVLDRATFPSDRLSSHLLLEKGVHLLREWGLLDDLLALGVPPVEMSRFAFGDWWVDIRHEHSEDEPPRFTCAPRRILLDQMMVEAARRAGAVVEEGVRVSSVIREAGRITGVVARREDGTDLTLKARVVIGADGLHSTVAAQVGSEVLFESAETTCQVYAYWRDVELDHMELGLRPGVAYGAFVADDGLVLVSVSRPVRHWRELWQGGEDAYRATLAEAFPGAAERMFAGTRVSPLRGTDDLPNRLRTAAGAGWALVGDAAMHKDPVTGLGMSDAFHGSAVLAAELGPSLDADDEAVDAALGRYAVRFFEATRPTFDLACRMAAHDFTDMEVPGLVMTFSDAVRDDFAAAKSDDREVAWP